MLLIFFLGMLEAALVYVAAIFFASWLRIYRVERDWTLLEERVLVERIEAPRNALTSPPDGARG